VTAVDFSMSLLAAKTLHVHHRETKHLDLRGWVALVRLYNEAKKGATGLPVCSDESR
jgi:hypothetical protein